MSAIACLHSETVSSQKYFNIACLEATPVSTSFFHYQGQQASQRSFEGLLLKVFDKSIKSNIWHIINNWYSNSSRYSGKIRNPLLLKLSKELGKRQSIILSPLLNNYF